MNEPGRPDIVDETFVEHGQVSESDRPDAGQVVEVRKVKGRLYSDRHGPPIEELQL